MKRLSVVCLVILLLLTACSLQKTEKSSEQLPHKNGLIKSIDSPNKILIVSFNYVQNQSSDLNINIESETLILDGSTGKQISFSSLKTDEKVQVWFKWRTIDQSMGTSPATKIIINPSD